MITLSPSRSVLALVGSVFLIGCAAASTGRPAANYGSGKIITAEMIAEYEVANAWDILKKTGAFRTVRDDGSGTPDLHSRRGRTSILLSSADIPRVILDGARISDLRYLREIPSHSIAWIQLLGAIEGTLYEGTNSGGGVILIVSKAGI